MKSGLKVVIYIILVILITFMLCDIFIKPKVLNFKATKEYEYIQNNKKNIEKVIIRNEAQLGKFCYKLDIKKGYDILNNIEIKKETQMWCSDSNVYLEFYFNDNTYKTIRFECGDFVYNGINYELKEEAILVNEDEYMPDKITEGMIIVSDKDKIDCE